MPALDRTRIIEDYEWFEHGERDEAVLEQVIEAQREEVAVEIRALEEEATKLAVVEIEELAMEMPL
jgi:hypothetical protein